MQEPILRSLSKEFNIELFETAIEIIVNDTCFNTHFKATDEGDKAFQNTP